MTTTIIIPDEIAGVRVGDTLEFIDCTVDIVRKISATEVEVVPWLWWRYYTTPIRQAFVRFYWWLMGPGANA